MLYELERARAVHEKRGENFARKIWRGLGTASTTIVPGLDALPDELAVLKGGLAVIFSVSGSVFIILSQVAFVDAKQHH